MIDARFLGLVAIVGFVAIIGLLAFVQFAHLLVARILVWNLKRRGRFIPWTEVLRRLDRGLIVVNRSSDFAFCRVWWIEDDQLVDDDPILLDNASATNCPFWLRSKEQIEARFPGARVEEYWLEDM